MSSRKPTVRQGRVRVYMMITSRPITPTRTRESSLQACMRTRRRLDGIYCTLRDRTRVSVKFNSEWHWC